MLRSRPSVIPCPASIRPDSPQAYGLLGAWPLNEPSGNGYALDSGPSNYQGTKTAVSVAGGPFGAAALFDGFSSLISGGFAVDLGSVTLTAWLYNGSGGSYKRLFTATSPGNTQVWSVGLLAGWLWQLSNGNDEYIYQSASAVPVGAWSHVAVVKDLSAGKVYFYINGVKDSADVTTSADPSPAGNFYMGATQSGTQLYDGMMSDVRIYGRALGGDEIQATYTSPFGLYGGRLAKLAGLASTLTLNRRRRYLGVC